MTNPDNIRMATDYVTDIAISSRDYSTIHVKVPKKQVKVDPGFANAIKGYVKTPDAKKQKRIDRTRVLENYNEIHR